MAADAESTPERRQAWQAISELFLDTEHDETSFRRIGEALAACSLPIAELDKIYADEVAPVLYYNTYSVAGAWAGFDLDWLEREILKRKAEPALWDRVSLLRGLRRRWCTRSTLADWEKVRALLSRTEYAPG